MTERIVNEFAAEMLKLLQSSSQFIGEQMPLVCQEALKYHLIISIVQIIIGGGIAIFGYWAFKKLRPGWEGIDDEPPYPHAVAAICYFATSVITVTNLFVILEILTAPRLFLLSYFSNLAR